MNQFNQFLEKLFNYQYFGLILLSIIAILAVLFIVIFAIAIKDSKKIKKNKELTILDDEYGEEKHDEENIAFKEESKEEIAEIPLDDILSETQDIEDALDVTLTDIESEIKLMDNDIDALENDSDLQSIAMSFAKEYKKERERIKDDDEEEIKEEKEEVKHIELPNFNDIPAPQPVKVIDEQPIIDSSKKKKKHRSSNPLDDIVGEEYNLK